MIALNVIPHLFFLIVAPYVGSYATVDGKNLMAIGLNRIVYFSESGSISKVTLFPKVHRISAINSRKSICLYCCGICIVRDIDVYNLGKRELRINTSANETVLDANHEHDLCVTCEHNKIRIYKNGKMIYSKIYSFASPTGIVSDAALSFTGRYVCVRFGSINDKADATLEVICIHDGTIPLKICDTASHHICFDNLDTIYFSDDNVVAAYDLIRQKTIEQHRLPKSIVSLRYDCVRKTCVAIDGTDIHYIHIAKTIPNAVRDYPRLITVFYTDDGIAFLYNTQKLPVLHLVLHPSIDMQKEP